VRHLGAGEVQRDISFNLEPVFLDFGLSDPHRVGQIVEAVFRDLSNLIEGFESLAPNHA
jgi:hypothetical protein